MPQMSSLNWMILMWYFFLILVLIVVKMSYVMKINLESKYKLINKYSFNLKW